MSTWLRRNEWITKPCQWCSSNECGGGCVNGTVIEVDMVTSELFDPNRITQIAIGTAARKQKSRTVFQWPEWKAFAARLGVSDRPLRKVVVTLDCDAAALVEETFIGLDTCPTHPSGTSHTGTSAPAQQDTPTPTPAPSVDTPDDGTYGQTHG